MPEDKTENGAAQEEAADGKPSQVTDVQLEPKGEQEGYATASYADIFRQFVVLGHVGLFQKVFVDKLKWMSSTVFLELLALGQCMPGPTSTQISFALGVTKKGIPGGLLSGILFQYPGLLMMSLIGAGAKTVLEDPHGSVQGITAGLSAVGVALVAGAAKGLCSKVCPDKLTTGICVICAVVAFCYSTAWLFPVLIACGGLITLYTKRHDEMKVKDVNESIDHLGLGIAGGAALIGFWAALLVLVVVLVDQIDYADAPGLHWFEAFYRTGSIIFGGGQVVLPLLLNDVVQTDEVCYTEGVDRRVCEEIERADTWVTQEEFFTGLAMAQAMPGPLFNFAAYLGAVMALRRDHFVLEGIGAAWLGLFGPGVMLIYGILPFWGRFRKLPSYRCALPGLNAAAVGLVVAAVFQMYNKVRDISVFPDASVAIGILGYTAVEHFGVQAPLAVVCGGVLGLIGWATQLDWTNANTVQERNALAFNTTG